MVTLLSIYLCLKGVCVVIPVPTSITYECGSMKIETLESFIEATFPKWGYKGFLCEEGRHV